MSTCVRNFLGKNNVLVIGETPLTLLEPYDVFNNYISVSLCVVDACLI